MPFEDERRAQNSFRGPFAFLEHTESEPCATGPKFPHERTRLFPLRSDFRIFRAQLYIISPEEQKRAISHVRPRKTTAATRKFRGTSRGQEKHSEGSSQYGASPGDPLTPTFFSRLCM